ncbi:putative protein NAP1 [Platanthera zijinensis]|uniref:Nck-associated protein 1 n=1 Tax=Platanthera zijinensis TaxID=2320716 RepID=A0AAP0G9S5_9ASPA
MAKPRPFSSTQGSSPISGKSKDWDNVSRWSEYLNPEESSSSPSTSWKHSGFEAQSKSANFQKTLQLEWVVRLSKVADGLLCKMYSLSHILGKPDLVSHTISDTFWKSGVFPNLPRICIHLSKKFPEHPNKLQLERVDKVGFDHLNDNAEVYIQNLEPWIMLLLDLMAFREQALRLILDLSSTVITLLMPRKMILQVYDLLYSITTGGRDCEFYHRLVQFIDSYDPPVKGLQEDLNFVSPRIGEVLEAVGPIVFLSTDTKKLRNEGFLSPFHPRYPDILTNSAHPMRAQDLANATTYREWVLLGYLVCPDELLRVTSIDIAMVVLKENLITTLFRDEYVRLHEDYLLHVLPKILESKKMAKSGRAKQKEADLEYNVAKQVEKMISEVHEQASISCYDIHRERRILLKQEIGRMVLFFADQPSLLAPNIQMVFSALALAQCEVIWYFQHVGITSYKSKVSRGPIDIDAADPTLGFLLDGMDKLCSLVRKYVAAIKGYALSYLSSSAGRIRFLLATPGMVALDLDSSLKGLFQQVVHCLENIPKPQGENISAVTCNLSEFRNHWLSILMIVTSSRSLINIRHLEKATVSTGKEGLLSEGNAAYNWSRCVDELLCQLSKHGSLRNLYFYRHHLTAVFRNTMFGPEGRPQHCCAWLGIASSFPECASALVTDESNKIGRDAILYVESLIESIMGGLEGLINILDSESGFGALEMQLIPEQAALRMNSIKIQNVSHKVVSYHIMLVLRTSYTTVVVNCLFYPFNRLEAAMQRLTSLCSVLNDMEPICVINHVFVLREYMRDCILGNFRRRLLAVIRTDSGLQRPSIMESLIRRHISIIHLAEQHISMDLTEGIREVLLTETFTGPISNLHVFEKPANLQSGTAVEIVSNWYIDNIIKDLSGAGVMFVPNHNCFKSTKNVGGYFADSYTDVKELKSLICIFGGYGFDILDRMMKEHISALLNCIDTALRANRESLEAIARSLNSGNQIERDANLRQILDIETLVNFSVQAGHTMAFRRILVEAVGAVLEERAPLILSLLCGISKHLPEEIPEKSGISRLRKVSHSVGGIAGHDMEWIHSVMEETGAAHDSSWSLLPYLCAAFMVSTTWSTTNYDVNTGVFNNNMHCLSRFINAVIGGNEFIRLERAEQQKRSLSNGHAHEAVELEMLSRTSVEASIKSVMQHFVKCSATIILESWSDTSRSHVVPKLIFLDQLCNLSPYLPRSTLELHVPYAILRSIYSQYHRSSQSMPAEIPLQSPRQSPLISLSHASPASTRQIRGDSTPNSGTYDPIHHSSSIQRQEDAIDKQQRSTRRSGPLDYTSSRKVKFADGSSSAGQGPSPLPRFAVSRSGPLLYK